MGHVLEEGLPVFDRESVEFFLMPLEGEESVALEQLVGVELGDAGSGLVKYEFSGLVKVLAYPAFLVEMWQWDRLVWGSGGDKRVTGWIVCLASQNSVDIPPRFGRSGFCPGVFWARILV